MNIDQLIPALRPYVSGCPMPIMLSELRRAARRFFERSTVWREEVYVGFGGGMNHAVIRVKDEQMLISVVRAQIMGKKDPLDPAPGGMNWISNERGEPKFYSSDKAGSLYLFPIPIVTTTCVIKVAVKPALGSNMIPDIEGDMYAELIAEGAASSILNMPDADWYNPKQADFHAKSFEHGIAEARNKMNMGYSNTGGRIYGGSFI